MGGRGEGLHWGMGGVDREHSLVGDEQAMPSQDWQYPGVSPSAVDLHSSAGEGVGRNEPDGLVGKGGGGLTILFPQSENRWVRM